MLGLTVGTLGGLAYKHDYYKDVQMEFELRRQDEVKKAQAFQEAQYLAKAFEKGKASSPYFQQKLNEHSEAVIRQMGAFMRTNPDWKYNPEKFMQFQTLSNSLRDNEWTQRSENLLAQSQLLHDALKSNPDLMKQKEFRDQFVQLANLRNTGSIDGVSENAQDYTFAPVQKWEDPMKLMAEFANQNLVNREYASEGGWMVSKVPQAELAYGSNMLMNLHKDLFQHYADEAGVSVEDYVRNGLLMAAKNNAKILPIRGAGRGSGGSGGGGAAADATSRFNTEIVNGSEGDIVNPSFSKAMTDGGQMLRVFVDGPTGPIPLDKQQVISLDTIGADYSDPKTKGLFKTFNVTAKMTLEEALRLQLVEDPWIGGVSVPDSKQKAVRIVEEKDGTRMVYVAARLPFSPNDRTFASAYNAAARSSQDYGPENSSGLEEIQDPTTGKIFYFNREKNTVVDAEGNSYDTGGTTYAY